MGNPLKLSGALPDDPKNGLFDPSTVLDFLAEPSKAVYVIGVLTNYKTEANNETGTNVPVLKFRHVEVVDAASAPAALAIMHRLHETRTGEMALPFEWGEHVKRPDRDFEDDERGD